MVTTTMMMSIAGKIFRVRAMLGVLLSRDICLLYSNFNQKYILLLYFCEPIGNRVFLCFKMNI